MSLWRRDGLRSWLAPGRVIVARRRAATAAFEAAFEAADPRGAIAALADALSSRLALAGVRSGPLDVTVSDHFVRYVALPWRAGLADAEWQVYAQHEFDRAFGKPPGPRLIRIAFARRGLPRIASGIDGELVASVRSAAAAQGLRVRTLQPNLSRVVECCGRRLRGDGHLIVAESDRLTRLTSRAGAWCEVQSARCGTDAAAALGRMLAESGSSPVASASDARLWYWGRADGIAESAARIGLAVQSLPRPADVPASCAALGLA